MKSKFTLEHEINYAPTVIRIGEHIHYDNMDNLVGINHNGLVALVSKGDPNYATNQLALFVPAGAQISEHFTRKLNLYRDITKNSDSTATPGYLEPNRRIKALRLRGVVSSGLVLPISFFTKEILEPGTQFDTINGEEFSRKYIVPVKVSNQKKTKAKTLQPLVAEEFFPEHFNTPFLLPNLDRLDPDMPIYVTQKLHGCFRSSTLVTLWDGSKKKIKDIKCGDLLIGYKDGEAVPTKAVRDAFTTGKTDTWQKLKFSRYGITTFSTPDHKFLTDHGYVSAEDLVVGDTVYWVRDEPSVKKEIISGDGSIERLLAGMEYKLPEKHRKDIQLSDSMTHYVWPVQVLETSQVSDKDTKWDIETETHNFIANGIVVHNSSLRISKTYLNNPNVFQRLFHLPTKRKKLGFVVGSHRVVKDSRLPQQHDIWNEVGSKYRDLIPDNYILYGEIIGWVNESTPIQRDYTYDQAPGSATFLVYRISIVLPDGRTIDLSFPQMREFCKARGLRTVPLLDIIRASDITPEYLEKFTDVDFSTLSGLIEKPIPLSDSTLPDEGITLRQDRDIPLILKFKSPLFYVHESLMMDMEIVDIEE